MVAVIHNETQPIISYIEEFCQHLSEVNLKQPPPVSPGKAGMFGRFVRDVYVWYV
uniref:Uncharacterized protein n=1 Tax=Anguilla anguilla TaxID=7936 RepID=A0A0E9XHF5_ANGAN